MLTILLGWTRKNAQINLVKKSLKNSPSNSSVIALNVSLKKNSLFN